MHVCRQVGSGGMAGLFQRRKPVQICKGNVWVRTRLVNVVVVVVGKATVAGKRRGRKVVVVAWQEGAENPNHHPIKCRCVVP